MITLFLILITGFIKITADIIRVPACMHDSFFKKYIGNWWIDPEIGWLNHKVTKSNLIFYPFLQCFGDLWHTLYTIFILMYISIGYLLAIGILSIPEYLNFVWFVGIAMIFHGIGVSIGNFLWRGHL